MTVQPYILVVEDEEALATLLHYNLDKEGYRVDICADGEEALIRIDEKLPDLVHPRLDAAVASPASRSAGACASAPPPATCRSSC